MQYSRRYYRIIYKEEIGTQYDSFFNQKNLQSIGVFGLHPHAGVTWITILLAEYLANICGLKVAVIEHSQKRDLFCLSSNKEQLEEEPFKVHNITYSLSSEKLLLNKQEQVSYDYLVYDLGCNYAKSRDLIMSCNKSLLVYTMIPWYFDRSKAVLALERDYGRPEHVTFLGNMITKEKRKLVGRIFRGSEFLGYEPDFFHPSKQSIQVFHNSLWN